MLLVTGASGLLGLAVVLAARERGCEVVAFSHHFKLRMPNVTAFTLNLEDHASVEAAVTQIRPTAIVHCAAASNVDWCEEHPVEAMRINAEASGRLAGLADGHGAQFIQISTDSVFDGATGQYWETDCPNPINVYAESKWKGEQAVLKRHPSAMIVRTTIYGWNAQPKRSLAEWIYLQLQRGAAVRGFVDVFFNPVLVNDLAEILFEMLDLRLTGVFHVGAPERLSKFEFARNLAAVFGFDPDLVIPARLRDANLAAKRPPDSSLRTDKIQAALGHSMPSVKAGLHRFRHLHDSGAADLWKSYVEGAAA